jgi:POT family proton-dependent oligopeptide transporter
VSASDKRQPAGLYLLFFTEMWERTSFYGMRALLTLYMTRAIAHGGFGWSSETSLRIYGAYAFMVYFTPLPGGYIADRFLGQRRSVMIGGALMVAGHFLMAVPGVVAFFSALGLIACGNGLFKPNISTMVGGLYREHDPRRDAGFTLFYMGINVGSFLAPLVCGTLGEKIGFDWGFAAAGFGMLLGQIVYVLGGDRLLGDVGKRPKKTQADAVEKKPFSKEESDRITVILIMAVFTIFFWAAFEQAGGLMNIYADQKVDRMIFGWEMPTTWFQSLNPAFVVLLSPVFAAVWVRLGRAGKEPSTPIKFALALLFVAAGFVLMVGAAKQSDSGLKASMGWLVGAYLFHSMGELCLSPVGLSMVTKLAPLRIASLMMGVWFFSNAISDGLSGLIGSFSATLGELQVFGGLVVVTSSAAVALFFAARPLVRRMHGVE